MSFASGLKMLDAERLQQTAKATVQGNGRLSLTVEAGRMMHLGEDKSLVIFAAENGDLGAIVSQRGDRNGFELKKAGTYFYLTFKNYLQEMGIDYKSQRIVYDITATNEKIEGKVLYRLARRVLPKETRELPLTEDEGFAVATPEDATRATDDAAANAGSEAT